MSITLNGEPAEMPTPATIAGLIAALGLEGQRLAIEHNGEIVPRSLWQDAKLADGDVLELVRAVGGG